MTLREVLDKIAAPSPTLQGLIAAKVDSDVRNYKSKHERLKSLIAQHPEDFVIDSDDGGGIVGIRHLGSGFQIHAPRKIIPVQLKRINQDAQRTPRQSVLAGRPQPSVPVG